MPNNTHTQLHVELADLARALHARTTSGPDAVLEEITGRAVEVVDGVTSAGITVTRRKKVVDSLAPTDAAARGFDDLQRQIGQGPCLDAAWQHRTVQVDDMTTERRWPDLMSAVREHSPIRSSVSFELFTAADGMGALNLYANKPYAITTEAIEVGYALAAHAALIFDAARRQEQFDSALASRDIIGQAKGMIMERFSIDAAQAFNLLVKLSQDTNVAVAAIARQLVSNHLTTEAAEHTASNQQ